ncbi:hypothetical protein BGZ52_010003 [Haplosporangium bisporale]|nr:hypothetical protein BGZ52_010003 [Haplosporangium bisporale]KAF9214579.1 hypothetical protein BGZ59_003431 [Podila verticillata]KFH65153.1 hypothetical protein MVEG_08634 [Podila verticillata NRRL 6337]
MGSLFSKSNKAQKSKDPKWQGIGPNTPLPGVASSSQQQTTRSHTLATIDSTRATTATTAKKTTTQHKPKMGLLLKLGGDPKKGGRKITKNLISLPSDFRHTGHIGAGEVRSGQIDPEKIKNQMAEVAACLKLDLNTPIPMLKTMPIQPENRDGVYSGPEPDRYGFRPSAGAVAAH